MANPIASMDFLKRKAEELRSKGTRRVMGSHPVPGTTPRREAEEPPRNRLRMGGGGGAGGEGGWGEQGGGCREEKEVKPRRS